MNRTRTTVPGGLFLRAEPGGVTVEAATAADGKPLRRFRMIAYTGGAMALARWPYPVVVDLAGLALDHKSRPILMNHDSGRIVGHTDAVGVEGGALTVAGLISGVGSAAREVVGASDNGFPWQASLGAAVQKVVFVPEGKTARANGREFAGPVYLVRQARLGEVSFVALGADDATSANVEAGILPAVEDNINLEIMTMDFEHWVEAKGVKLAELTDEQTAKLKALYATETKAAGTDSGSSPAAPPDGRAPDAAAAVRAERERVAAIQAMCAGEFPAVEKDAIGQGWTVAETSQKVLSAMRESRPRADVHLAAGRERGRTCDATTLEAACVLAAKLSEPEKHYPEDALEQAERRFRGGIGLQELLLEAAWANGYTGRTFRDSREVLRCAFGDQVQAGFSTVDLGGILSNVANKFLLEGFYSVERTWRNICAVRNVPDFKTVTSYRLIGKDQYELVAPGGELKHGTLGSESFTNKADTYGLMLTIDRRDIINDDLGAITLVPRKLGRGSGLKINDVFWTCFLNNAAFFAAGNKNYLDGADTALSIDGLSQAEVAFMDQVDADGKPIGVMPAILLVPTALSAVGTQLFKAVELRDTTASTKYPVANPHVGKFRVEVGRYLANATYAGASAKAWYLLAEPADLPVIEVAFLNGQEAPVIETAEADFNVLGVQMRGYHDFGVALQDPRGGLKMKGEA